MSFNGREGEQITLPEASKLTSEYRIQNPTSTKGHFIGRDLIERILEQEDCQGLRIYHGIDHENDDSQEIVVVGADSNEDDLLEVIADRSIPCPPRCGTPNALNS